MPKKSERGDTLESPGTVCYAEKHKKTFLVQFAKPNASIWQHKISYNFQELFCQFVFIEKKVTIIVAFHFMKRRPKKIFYN